MEDEILEVQFKKVKKPFQKVKLDKHPGGNPNTNDELLNDIYCEQFTDNYRNECIREFNAKNNTTLPYVGERGKVMSSGEGLPDKRMMKLAYVKNYLWKE